jgi:hypothetical protein
MATATSYKKKTRGYLINIASMGNNLFKRVACIAPARVLAWHSTLPHAAKKNDL